MQTKIKEIKFLPSVTLLGDFTFNCSIRALSFSISIMYFVKQRINNNKLDVCKAIN